MPEPGAAAGEVNSAEAGGKEGTKIPAGILPIFFTGAGQKIFGCVVDDEVTLESPNKLIPKDKIIKDFRDRAAVSDFHPIKKKVLVSSFLI